MKTGGYARTVGSCDLYVRPLFCDQVYENLEAVYALGLLGALPAEQRQEPCKNYLSPIQKFNF